MTLSARVALVKRVPAGEGVSYGHAWTAETDTTLALVPIGYADGVPRRLNFGGRMRVLLGGRLRPVVGRVCMDQVVVDCGPACGEDEVAVGDRAVLFGPGSGGEPTAQDWADELGTIHYEVVTGVHGSARAPHGGRTGPGWTARVTAGSTGSAHEPPPDLAGRRRRGWARRRRGHGRRRQPGRPQAPPRRRRPAHARHPADHRRRRHGGAARRRALIGDRGRRRAALVRGDRAAARHVRRAHRRARARVRARPAHLALPAPVPGRTPGGRSGRPSGR